MAQVPETYAGFQAIELLFQAASVEWSLMIPRQSWGPSLADPPTAPAAMDKLGLSISNTRSTTSKGYRDTDGNEMNAGNVGNSLTGRIS